MRSKKLQSGFTLIELVVVIIILGVLAAIALPRFANLQAQARIAKMNGALGAMKSAAAMSHALLLANGYPTNYNGNPGTTAPVGPDISIEGVDVVYTYGYPNGPSIVALAGLTAPVSGGTVTTTGGTAVADFVTGVVGGNYYVRPDAQHAACQILYTPAINTANSTPTYDISGLTVDNCD